MPEFDLETLDIASPEHYEKHGYPHPEWTYLRKHAPVFWYARDNVDPFWAITKHADIVEIGKQPDKFLNAPRLAVFTNELEPPEENTVRHLLNMDPPDHGRYRNVAAKQFTPRSVSLLAPHVERITREVLDEAGQNERCDFVQDVSAKITIAVIAEMLGVPRGDWNLLFKWTNETIAPQDPEFQRGGSAKETLERSRMELFAYFHEMAIKRRAQPTNDIVSVVANGQVGGKPLEPVELLSYYFLLVVAGNETTRNAMTGGLLAFIENPGRVAQARARRLAPRPRGGGDRALDDAGDPVRAHRHAGLRAARQEDPRGRIRLPLLSVGEPRRRRLRRARALPDRPPAERAHRLRPRRARVPRRAPRAPRAALRLRAAARAARARGARGRARSRALELRRRHQARPDPVAPRAGVSFRTLILASFAVWAVIVLGTYLAGEQTEVVRLQTRDETGQPWMTKLWVVDLGDVTWVRVANPQRAWYRRLLANPKVELVRGGRSEPRLAIPDETPATRASVDEAFAAKYGLVDRWYGLLVRHDAVPIRLVPREPEP